MRTSTQRAKGRYVGRSWQKKARKFCVGSLSLEGERVICWEAEEEKPTRQLTHLYIMFFRCEAFWHPKSAQMDV